MNLQQIKLFTDNLKVNLVITTHLSTFFYKKSLRFQESTATFFILSNKLDKSFIDNN